jgi:hypothetical protein
VISVENISYVRNCVHDIKLNRDPTKVVLKYYKEHIIIVLNLPLR